MKKQYMIAVLLLIGAATVSTMAFNVVSDVDDDFTLYDITPAGGKVTVTNVRTRVINADTVYFKILLDTNAGDDARFHISFKDQNDADVALFTTCTVTYAFDSPTVGALDVPATTTNDKVLVIDMDTVADGDYITLKIVGDDIAFDGSDDTGGDLASMVISAYDMAGLSDTAGAYTEAEASDM